MNAVESAELYHDSCIRAICMAALAGNSKIDAQKTAESLNKLMSSSFEERFPYVKQYIEEEKKRKQSKYDFYFKQLEALKKKKSKMKDGQKSDATSKK